MKEKVKYIEFVNADGDDRDVWICPICNKVIYNPWIHKGKMFEKCPYCGQELDWNYDIPDCGW